MNSPSKYCSRCKQIKCLTAFTRNRRMTDGFNHYCKPCDHKHQLETVVKNPIPTLYGRFKSLVKWKKRESSITFEDFEYFLKQPCVYCGQLLNPVHTKFSYWLDRIDNKKGYHKENILPCCGTCNIARGDRWSVPEFKVMMTALLAHRSQQNQEKKND